MPRAQPLRRRLFATQALVILLLAAGVLAAALWGAQRAIQSLSRELVDRAAIQVAEHLDRLYEPAGEHLYALSELARLGLLEPGKHPRDLRRLAVPWFDSKLGIGAFGIFADDGRGIAMRRTPGGWDELAIRPGEAPHASDPAETPLAFDARKQSWWLPPSIDDTGPTTHWSDRVQGGLVERAGLAASRRVVNAAGEGRVVVIELLLDRLLVHLAELEVTAGTVTAVLDREGRLVAWAGPSWPAAATAEALFLRRPRDLGVALFDDARQELDASRARAQQEALRFASGGEAWWGRLRPFALPGGGEQLVAVLVPASDLLRDRARQIGAVLALTGLALILALATARRMGRSVARPLEALVGRSERIAAGDLDPEPVVVSNVAEVKRLAEAQEAMRAGLKTLLKLERDLQIASQIQRATWPTELPRVPGLDLAASAHPADETGGDGYDMVAIPESAGGGTFLFLADATGHGIGPALSVTQLRSMLRMAMRSGLGLADVVQPVNAQLYADLPDKHFITAWFGRLDADGRGLDSLSAGQAPLLHYHAADDRLEVWKADVPPLGLFPVLPAKPPRRVELAPGDLWVVLSDGFYEAVDPADAELGVERIGAVLRRMQTRPAAEIVAALRTLLEEFTAGAPAADDQTALLLRRER